MELTLSVFLSQAGNHPILLGILALVIGVTIISGATDAPNAIASAVSTRCLTPGAALALAAVFNFVGLVGMTYISTAVAHTMFNMVDFSGNTHQALLALIAAMIGSIGWGVFCWFWGIPASKSHSLIAGVTGGAIALNGLAGVVLSEWMLVIYGMVFSLVGGFILGMTTTKIIEFLFSGVNRQRGNKVCMVLQDICACALSFLHGAQDGQKFMSIGLLGIALAFGMETSGATDFPLWLMIICSAAMSLGTLLGGKRIIKSVAMDMVSLEKYQGVGGLPLHGDHAVRGLHDRHARLHVPLLHRLHHGRRRLEELPPRELGRRPPYGVGLGAHLPLLRIYRLGLGQAVHDAVEKGPDMSPGPWVNRSWDRLTLPQRLLLGPRGWPWSSDPRRR